MHHAWKFPNIDPSVGCLPAYVHFEELHLSGLGTAMKRDNWTSYSLNVGKTIINHPFGNGNHTTYKNGDDWGMVFGIVLPTWLVL